MARVSSHELFKMVNTNDIERINETIGEWCRVDSEGNHIHTPGCIGVYRELLSYASAKAKNGELSKEITELLVEAFSWYVDIFKFARFATLSGLTSYTPSEKTVIPDWLIGALNTLAEKPNSKVTFTLKNMRYDRLCALIGYLTTEGLCLDSHRTRL